MVVGNISAFHLKPFHVYHKKTIKVKDNSKSFSCKAKASARGGIVKPMPHWRFLKISNGIAV